MKPDTSMLIAVAEIGKRNQPARASMIDQALEIAATGLIEYDGHAWQVPSQSQSGTSYAVNGSCGCPHPHATKAGICKHVMAVALWVKAMEWAEAQAQVEQAMATLQAALQKLDQARPRIKADKQQAAQPAVVQQEAA
jgi:hypothetical protein